MVATGPKQTKKSKKDQLIESEDDGESISGSESDKTPADNKRIIVCVDSNFINLQMNHMLLQMANYKGAVKCFQDSQSAINFFANEVPKLKK